MDNWKIKITMITTGGTIEKSYDEYDGSLGNRDSIIRKWVFEGLRLPYTEIELFSIFAKDSLEMDDEDREFLATCIVRHLKKDRPVLILHGTDTMDQSAAYCKDKLKDLKQPVVFTGAMMPLGFVDSDAQQNVTEALMACKLLRPGVYVSFHNRIFEVPNVRKNRDKRTFESFAK